MEGLEGVYGDGVTENGKLIIKSYEKDIIGIIGIADDRVRREGQ